MWCIQATEQSSFNIKLVQIYACLNFIAGNVIIITAGAKFVNN